MASRLGDYLTEESAVDAVKSLAGFHDSCNCREIEVYSNAYVPKINHDLRAEWKQVEKNDDLTNKENLALWRKHIRETRPMGSAIREILPDVRAVIYPSARYLDLHLNLLKNHAQFNKKTPAEGVHTKEAVLQLSKLLKDPQYSGKRIRKPKNFINDDAGDWWLYREDLLEEISKAFEIRKTSFSYNYYFSLSHEGEKYDFLASAAPTSSQEQKISGKDWKVTPVYPVKGKNVAQFLPSGEITPLGGEENEN